jgi:plasmid stabilization system protein ParE
LERLHKFLHEKSPDAAARAAQAILDGSNLLKDNPELGRLMPDETRRRELFVSFGVGAYVLRYRIDAGSAVVIIRVWHSRENRES